MEKYHITNRDSILWSVVIRCPKDEIGTWMKDDIFKMFLMSISRIKIPLASPVEAMVQITTVY